MQLKTKITVGLALFILSSSAFATNALGLAIGTAGFLVVATGLAVISPVAIMSGVAIGAIGLAVGFHNGNTSATSANVPINVQLNPNQPLTPPAGWTAAGSGKIQPTPPATTATVWHYWISSSATNKVTDKNLIVQDQLAIILTGGDTAKNIDCSGTAASCTYTRVAANGNVYSGTYTVSFNAGMLCPIGYVTSGSTCALTNASQVIKPVTGQQNIILDGNNFKNDPLINPQDIFPPTKVSVAPKQVTVKGDNGSVTNITINNDNSITITGTSPNSDGTTTQRYQFDYGPPDASGNRALTGKSEGSLNGQGTGVTDPSTGGGSSIDISSLNKEATQQAIKAGQCGGTNEPACKIDETGTANATTQSNTDDARQKTELNSKFDSIKDQIDNQHDGVGNGLQNPLIAQVPSSTCSDPVFDASDVNPNAHVTFQLCEHAAQAQPLLTWITYLATILAIWNLWFRRVGGAA